MHYYGIISFTLLIILSIWACYRYKQHMQMGSFYGNNNFSRMIYLNLVLGLPLTWGWCLSPFLPQPRLHGILSILQHQSAFTFASYFSVLIGFAILLYAMIVQGNVQKSNLTQTSADYARPKQLIIEGEYQKLRHPIIILTLFMILGLSLITGALYSLITLPFYFLICHYTAVYEEKYALRPLFGQTFENYRKKVPAYFTPFTISVFIILFTASILNYFSNGLVTA
ncbi:hypothetical protein DMA11_11760 [Marinilabiliaceae bacterium JC017]|nr:hypothetical protein DMA11_11760 [Marinilabiliaceae bacterium JC017]